MGEVEEREGEGERERKRGISNIRRSIPLPQEAVMAHQILHAQWRNKSSF